MNIHTIKSESPIRSDMMQDMAAMKQIADAPVIPALQVNSPTLSSSSGPSFSSVIGSALRHVDGYAQQAQQRQTAIDMGKSDDLVGAMIASQQASLSFSALVQVRNKIATGVNELMSMSV